MFSIPLMLTTIALGNDAAELRFLAPIVDLGEIKGLVTQSHRFRFVNDSTAPVDLIDVERSCGCLVGRLEKKRLQPGETGVLVLETRAAAQLEGPHTWFAKIRFIADGKLKFAELRLKARVRNEVTLKPALIGYDGPGPFRQEIELDDTRPTPLHVTDVHTSQPFLKTTILTRDRGRTRILVEAPAGIAPDRYDARLVVHTSDPAYTAIEVPVTLNIRTAAQVSVLPERVNLQPVAGQPSMLVRLHTAADAKIVIQRITPADDALTCTWASGPGHDATLRVRVDPNRMSTGVLQSSLRVVLSQPAEILIIPVHVNGN